MSPAMKERLRILRELDVDAALASVPGASEVVVGGYKDTGVWADKRETALAGLHKARLRQPNFFTKEERQASIDWLYAKGWRVPLR